MNYNFINLSNKRFGRLLAESPTDARRGRGVVWKCLCDCGNIKLVSSADLRQGVTRSCGCLHKELTIERSKKSAQESSFNELYYKYKETARNRLLDFAISRDEFRILTQQKCYYCGIEPKQIRKGRKNINGDYIHNGIDRVDSDIGYILENCVPCCKICNYAKRNLSVNEFTVWVNRVYNNLFGDGHV